jgi:hypothetical protein
MGKMSKSAESLLGLSEDTVVRRDMAEAGQRKTGIDVIANMAFMHSVASDGIVEDYTDIFDDDIPPQPAQNVTLTPLIGGLAVQWDAPPGPDRVKRAEVRVTPDGGVAETFPANTIRGHTLLGLEGGTLHAVEVMLTDAYALESGWTTAVEETPLMSAIDSIDFGAIEIAGALGWENLEPLTDPDMLGDDVVVGRAMAAHDAAMFNLWAGTAMIESAKVATMVVDKLVGGTLSTTDILVGSTLELATGGDLVAGDISLNAEGIVMPLDTGSINSSASANRTYKIAALDEYSALSFFDNSPTAKGVLIRSEADASVVDLGRVVIQGVRRPTDTGANDSTLTAFFDSGLLSTDRATLFVDGNIEGIIKPTALMFWRSGAYRDVHAALPDSNGVRWLYTE